MERNDLRVCCVLKTGKRDFLEVIIEYFNQVGNIFISLPRLKFELAPEVNCLRPSFCQTYFFGSKCDKKWQNKTHIYMEDNMYKLDFHRPKSPLGHPPPFFFKFLIFFSRKQRPNFFLQVGGGL